MNDEQAKRFLRIFAEGKKLDKITIRDLYLSGYIGIELHSVGKELLPTTITEKGKRALEGQKPSRNQVIRSTRSSVPN
jgi:hypothetical protein